MGFLEKFDVSSGYGVKSVVYWTINQYSTACVKRWRCLEYVYPLMYCLVLLFSIAFVINKQWALLNDFWINTHYRYLGFIRTHPTIYNRLCIWLAVSPYMNGCAWLRARWPYTLYHPTDFNPSHKITLGLITTTKYPGKLQWVDVTVGDNYRNIVLQMGMRDCKSPKKRRDPHWFKK